MDSKMLFSHQLMNDYIAYVKDSFERSVLFLDVMRKRGNNAISMEETDFATVLSFPIEIILDGATFSPPINYWLARVLPLDKNTVIDEKKRPYVIQDPRAGRGPGIAGFKPDSEIGAALKHGHPVYFIGFDNEPCLNQTYEDVIRAQIKFYQYVTKLHPHSPKLCAIGNCAAGYLSMFSAIQQPDLFGSILIAGSPLSFWNGERGRNPLRYSVGMFGGSWLISLLGDIGGGQFDGCNLVMNFNNLNFDNFLWDKQYNLYANIDTDAERFLQFERWLSAFADFNSAEIKWMVDKLFVANLLTTGSLTTEDGINLDLRNISAPIVTFVSDGDNISPPAQSAGWIADLYADVDEIILRNKTIVYCLNNKVGHLALFTGSKVAKRENQIFVENMDTISLLPPGLYELVLDEAENPALSNQLCARYVARNIEDIKRLGYNNIDDDRAFATMAKASAAYSNVYDNFIHPLFKLYDNPWVVEVAEKMQPLRWSYWVFADAYNPWMKVLDNFMPVKPRQELNAGNVFHDLEQKLATQSSEALQQMVKVRDYVEEQRFFMLWGNPWAQKFWGTANNVPRYTPSITQFERGELLKTFKQKILKQMPLKSQLAAVFRVIALLVLKRRELRAHTAQVVFTWAKTTHPELTEQELGLIVRAQFEVVWHDRDEALAYLRKFVLSKPEADKLITSIKELLANIENVAPKLIHELEVLAMELNIR